MSHLLVTIYVGSVLHNWSLFQKEFHSNSEIGVGIAIKKLEWKELVLELALNGKD